MQALIDAIHRAYPEFEDERDTLQTREAILAFMERFARFIIILYESGKRDELLLAFEIMENGLLSGDDEVRGVIVYGFYEALQNVASHRSYGAGVFQSYLAGQSNEAWEQLNKTWKDKDTLAEVVAQETGASLKFPWWMFWRRRRRLLPSEMLQKVKNPELRVIIEGMTRDHSKGK